MSTLHGADREFQMGRGELRKPESRSDQPGQRIHRTPLVEHAEGAAARGMRIEPHESGDAVVPASGVRAGTQ